jgi:hypothetical protein
LSSWVIINGRNFEAKPSAKSLFAKTAAQCAPVGVVLELLQMDKLIDRPGVGLEVADEVLVVASLTKRRKAEFLVELHRLGDRADGSVEVLNSYRALDQSGRRAAISGIPYRRVIACGLGPCT